MLVGVKFCVENSEIAKYVQRMLPKYIIISEISSTAAELTIPLVTTVDSPLEFLNY